MKSLKKYLYRIWQNRVLERLFILMPKTPGIESTQIYTEARNLYSEIKAEAEPKATAHWIQKWAWDRILISEKVGIRTFYPDPGPL